MSQVGDLFVVAAGVGGAAWLGIPFASMLYFLVPIELLLTSVIFAHATSLTLYVPPNILNEAWLPLVFSLASVPFPESRRLKDSIFALVMLHEVAVLLSPLFHTQARCPSFRESLLPSRPPPSDLEAGGGLEGYPEGDPERRELKRQIEEALHKGGAKTPLSSTPGEGTYSPSEEGTPGGPPPGDAEGPEEVKGSEEVSEEDRRSEEGRSQEELSPSNGVLSPTSYDPLGSSIGPLKDAEPLEGINPVIDPLDPIDPVDSKDPLDPMDPLDPRDPLDPVDPLDVDPSPPLPSTHSVHWDFPSTGRPMPGVPGLPSTTTTLGFEWLDEEGHFRRREDLLKQSAEIRQALIQGSRYERVRQGLNLTCWLTLVLGPTWVGGLACITIFFLHVWLLSWDFGAAMPAPSYDMYKILLWNVPIPTRLIHRALQVLSAQAGIDLTADRSLTEHLFVVAILGLVWRPTLTCVPAAVISIIVVTLSSKIIPPSHRTSALVCAVLGCTCVVRAIT